MIERSLFSDLVRALMEWLGYVPLEDVEARLEHQLQPMPEGCAIVYSDPADPRSDTTIARTWAKGDPARCRLCPLGHCMAGNGQLCLITVKGRRIADEDAWLFARRDVPDEGWLANDPRLPGNHQSGQGY